MDPTILNIIFIGAGIAVIIGLFFGFDAILAHRDRKRVEEIKEKYRRDPEGNRSNA